MGTRKSKFMGRKRMNEKTEITKRDMVLDAIILALFLLLGVMAIYIRSVQDKLNALEQTTNQNTVSQQSQIDGLSLNIEAVRNDMSAGFEEQQAQIDSQQEQIQRQKQISSATNKAFTRFQNQQSKVEEELREELKKD